MTDLDSERIRIKFSIAQIGVIVGAIAVCTWRVNETLNELRNDVRKASEAASAAWTVEDQNRWVWLANRNTRLALPYPIELKATP